MICIQIYYYIKTIFLTLFVSDGGARETEGNTVDSMLAETRAPGEKLKNGANWEGSGWRVRTVKKSILSSAEIDDWTDRIKIPIPEMIFGNNLLEVQHVESGLTIQFNAFDALDRVDKTGQELVQVAHSKEWQSARQKRRGEADVRNMAKPFDWTYTTDYKGTTHVQDECNVDGGVQFEIDAKDEIYMTERRHFHGHSSTRSSPSQLWISDPERPIPTKLLTLPEPILLFDEVSLYEDELGDNGIVWLNAKVRVMPERMLILSRLFLRVDGVLFRVRDTRVYVEFGTGLVLREYKEQEGPYNLVKSRLPMNTRDYSQYLRDANWVSQQLPVTKVKRDSIHVENL